MTSARFFIAAVLGWFLLATGVAEAAWHVSGVGSAMSRVAEGVTPESPPPAEEPTGP